MTRVAILSATYRTYGFNYVRGLISALRPDPEVAARLERLDVELVPALGRGYGGGRQTGQLMQAAADAGCEVAVTVECDMAWTGLDLVRLLEAHRYLSGPSGAPVAVGASYPASSSRRVVLCVLGGTDEDTRDALRRIVELPDSAADEPAAAGRYAFAGVLPCGFTAWPVREATAVEIVERCGAWTNETYDRALSESLRARGVELFYDLALSVGHEVALPMTAREAVKAYGGGEA